MSLDQTALTAPDRSPAPKAGRSGFAMRRRIRDLALVYALPALAVGLFGLPTIIQPFWPDQAIFSAIGRAIANGGFPYTDAWDQKPPAIYLLYALAIQGPFNVMKNVRLFDLGWTVATVVALTALGRRYWTVRAGIIAGLIYGLIYIATAGWWQSAQPDSFIGLPLVLALLLYESRTGSRGRLRLIAAGVLLGIAFQFRFISALLIPLFPWVELRAAAPRSWFRLWFGRMLFLGIGFAALQAVLLLYLAAGGALGEYITATRFASGYTRLGGPWQGPEGPTLADYIDTVRLSFPYWALSRIVLTAPPVAGGFVGVFLRRERRVEQMVIFTVLVYVGIAAQAKFFWYHYGYMMPFLALLGGWTWDQIWTALRRHSGRAFALAGTGILLGGLLASSPEAADTGFHQWRDFQNYVRHPGFRTEYLSRFTGHRESVRMAAYLKENTRPGEHIYIWGYDPLIYLNADRPSSSRFIYCLPMMSDWAPASYQAGFMEEMQARPPVFFVAQRFQGGPWITGHSIDPVDYIPYFPALHAWLSDNYDYLFDQDAYVVWRRRQ